MKSNLAIKGLAIFVISIILVFVLQMIEFKVDERNAYRNSAKSAISQGWSGSQLVVAPVLRLSLSKQYEEEIFDQNLKAYVTKKRKREWSELLVADDLSITGEVVIQERYKGIYKIPVYETSLTMTGRFPKLAKLNGEIVKAELLSSFSDMRGLSSTPTIMWQEHALSFATGTEQHLLGHYISADVSKHNPADGADFKMQVKLRGLDNLEFVPTAREFVVQLESAWQHPYFIGRYLPDTRSVGEQGFSASWRMSEFATSITQSIAQCQKARQECASILRQNSFGVGLHSPIDIYQKTDRSLKYGFLFILLTFAVFCLFEVLKRIQIHPIQYGLVGAALALFYLLLISLSEHLSFAWSYLVAAVSCISLIGFYLKHVFNNKGSAVLVVLGMAALYGMLYIILKSEDFALLMGSALTFISLAALMIVTRKTDWYGLSNKASALAENTVNTPPENSLD